MEELSGVSAKFMDIGYRTSILNQIGSWENKDRKFQSFKQFEVYHDRCNEYVLQYLESQFSKETIQQMPIVDSVNIAKRIVNKQSTLYNEMPVRNFTGLDAEQNESMKRFYEENCLDGKLKSANGYLKLMDQAFALVVPDGGKLKLRTILPHQLDVIPNETDPEIADAIIISTFDRSYFFRPRNRSSDNNNADIADYDDYRQTLEKTLFLVWTKQINFIMNGRGEFVSEIKPNPIGELPYLDVAQGKETEFFVRGGRALTDFSVQFNGVLSDIYNVVKMQGWAVGYLKGSAELMPQSLVIGPSKLIRLPIDPNNPIPTEIGFASPNADIDGSLKFLETLISLFLSSRGMDSRAVSVNGQAQTYSSGVEKLLAMLDVFEATKEDFGTMKRAEKDLLRLITKWSNYYLGTELQLLDFELPDDLILEINYIKPEMVTSDIEKVSAIEKRLSLNLITQTEAIAQDRGISVEAAEQVKMEIEEEIMEDKQKRMEAISGVQSKTEVEQKTKTENEMMEGATQDDMEDGGLDGETVE
jgi:hypothetical protein